MKKLTILISAIMCAMIFGISAYANTFENTAFTGSWVAHGADGQVNAQLDVDYCDSQRIKCRFKTIKDGEVEREYDIYQCPIDDIKANTRFGTVKSANNWFPEGVCSIELMRDMIKFSITTDSGVKLYEGLFKPQIDDFNPYISPYNYNVKINVNGNPIEGELSPFILKNRTYVPLRGVFESMGIEVIWNDTKTTENGIEIHTHEILAVRDKISVSISKKNKANKGFSSWYMNRFVNSQTQEIDISEIQPVIIDDNTYIPLRVVVESFNSYIDWDNDTRTVIINDIVQPTIPEETPEVTPEPEETPVSEETPVPEVTPVGEEGEDVEETPVPTEEINKNEEKNTEDTIPQEDNNSSEENIEPSPTPSGEIEEGIME